MTRTTIGPQRVGRDHDPAAVVAVGPGAGEQPDGDRRQRDQDRHQGDRGGRAGQVEDQQEQREVGHAVADVGDRLGEVEAPEVGDAQEVADADRGRGGRVGHRSAPSLHCRRWPCRRPGRRSGAAWVQGDHDAVGQAVGLGVAPELVLEGLEALAELGGSGGGEPGESAGQHHATLGGGVRREVDQARPDRLLDLVARGVEDRREGLVEDLLGRPPSRRRAARGPAGTTGRRRDSGSR